MTTLHLSRLENAPLDDPITELKGKGLERSHYI